MLFRHTKWLFIAIAWELISCLFPLEIKPWYTWPNAPDPIAFDSIKSETKLWISSIVKSMQEPIFFYKKVKIKNKIVMVWKENKIWIHLNYIKLSMQTLLIKYKDV